MEHVKHDGPQPVERARTLRLLVVAHSLEHGGAEHSLLALLERLDRAAFDCRLAAPEGPMRERYLARCRPAVTLRRGYLPLTWQMFSYARAFYATVVNTVTLWRYLKREPADLVLTNTGVALHGPLAAALRGIPAVTMMRELLSPPFVRTAVSRLLLRLNRLVIANSRAIVSAVGRRTPGRLLLVHGGVEIDPSTQAPASSGGLCSGFRPTDEVAEAGCSPVGLHGVRPAPALPAGGPLVGIVGTVHPIKGHEAFLRMAAAVARRIPSAGFVVVGRYDEQSRYYRTLLRFRRELGLEERTLFTGHVDPVAPVLERMAVLVITSSTESFPRAALEAMAAGRPVAAFDVGGVSDLVRDGETGRLVRSGDVDGLAEAVCGLLEDDATARRMGAAGRDRVEAEFSAERQAARVAAALLESVS